MAVSFTISTRPIVRKNRCLCNRIGVVLGLCLTILVVSCADEPLAHYVRRADALKARGDIRQAVVEYQKAIREHPYNIVPYFNQALLFAKLKNYARAVDNCAVISRLDPASPFAPYGLGRVRFAENNLDSAAAEFRSALLLPMPSARLADKVRLYLGRISARKNDGATALKYFDEILVHVPVLVEAYFYRAQTQADILKNPLSALADYREYLNRDGARRAEAEARIKSLEKASIYEF